MSGLTGNAKPKPKGKTPIPPVSLPSGVTTSGTGFDWNAATTAAIDAQIVPILGQDGSDPLGLSQLFPAGSVGLGHPAESIGARRGSVSTMTAAAQQKLGQILGAAGVITAKKTLYTTAEVQSGLVSAFKLAGESSAASLSDYLAKAQTSAQAAGISTTTLNSPTAQTTYTAGDIQATADAVGQATIGRKLNATEMQGVLNQMNSASGAKASAEASRPTVETTVTGTTTGAPAGTSPAAGAGGRATAQQVYAEVLAQGGSVLQGQVAAALVSGIESDGDPKELAGGIGPAQGLFQFEPGTWKGSAGGGKGGLPATVGAATWQQQVTGFLNATRGDHFGAWGPDLVANSGNPNSSSNPAYGYAGAPQKGSRVANMIAKLGPTLTTTGGAAAPVTAPAPAATTTTTSPGIVYPVPADPSQSEATTNYLETQDSPEYQANNLLKVFGMIQTKLATPDSSLNAHVLTSPLVMK